MPPTPVLHVKGAFRVMTWKKVVKTRGVKWKQEKTEMLSCESAGIFVSVGVAT